MKVLGIDPGLSGALAFNTGDSLRVFATPTVQTQFVKNGKKKTRSDMNLPEVVRLIRENRPDVAFIEKVAAMKGQGVTGMFRFGQNFGQWQGILAALGIRWIEVTPQVWKKQFHLSRDKGASLDLARKLYPNNLESFRLKKHDGLAEAALIRHYGLQESITLVL